MKKQTVTPKEQCDEYYNFYLSIGLTPYECKRCTIHLINEMIKFGAGTPTGCLFKRAYWNEVKSHATQL